MSNLMKVPFAAAIGASMFFAVPVVASAKATAVQPSGSAAKSDQVAIPVDAQPGQWELKETHGKWGVLCNGSNDSDCRAVQSQNYADEKTPGRLLQTMLAIENGRTFALLTLPFGVDLRAGLAVQVDEGDEVKGSFVTCLPDGCQSIIELDPNLLPQVRTGKLMKVGFRPWGGDDKTFVVEVPLEGSAAAMAALVK